MKNKYFMLFACCIPVKGSQRSLICDVQRSKYTFIDNDIYNILVETKKRDVEKILSFFPNDNHHQITSFFDYLVENELGFYTTTPNDFPSINLAWLHSSPITNVIIDLSTNNRENIISAMAQIEDFRCKALQIRCYNDVDLDSIFKIVDLSKNYTLESIELLLPYTMEMENNNMKSWIENNNRIKLLLYHSSPRNEIQREDTYTIAYSSENLNNQTHCGKIFENMFSLNIPTFTEAQLHNTCLNRKISIDVEGNIKNCPSMAQNFGNIKDTTLQEALDHPDFKKYWNINKNQIDVCKDCEFRYICTDCRAYIENPEDMYSKPLKCGYNPYTAEWEEWSTNPLKQKAIEYYGMQEFVKIQ